MPIVYLIGCGKSKRPDRVPARELYTGALFQKSLAYAELQGGGSEGSVFILSALHGLVEPGRVLGPYDCTMRDLSVWEESRWVNGVLAGLCARGLAPRRTHLVFLAGRAYVDPLARHCPTWSAPMTGLGIGERLAWLNRELAQCADLGALERGRAAA